MPEANMSMGLGQSFKALVSDKFRAAKASQSLIFSNTQLAALHNRAGIPFQLRYCPALSRKPRDDISAPPPPPSSASGRQSGPPKQKKFDPFEDPSPDLLVARVPESGDHTHNVVLNKFPVIANHFILATRDNKPQTHLLEEADLDLTYACIQAWQDGKSNSNLYAFFNSGEHSGASQPHRHLQFLSVEDMRDEAGHVAERFTNHENPSWDVLCDRMATEAHQTLPICHDPSLAILHLASPISTSLSPSELYHRYLLLLRAASVLIDSGNRNHLPRVSSLSQLDQDMLPPSASLTSSDGTVLFSYNLCLTSSIMAILPRCGDDAAIPGLPGSKVSVNGTILAGTLMVKEVDEWDAMRTRDGEYILDEILKQVAYEVEGDGGTSQGRL